MKVTVFGSGYVGLVTGVCLAQVGNEVVSVDIDEERIKRLRDGECPIFEPGLEPMLAECLELGVLSFTTSAQEGVEHGEVLFIAVGTPSDKQGAANLDFVDAVADSIGTFISAPCVVINKSTVPVGTAERVRKRIQRKLDERGSDVTFSVVSNPEFLKEGAAVNDFKKPDRIIVGTDDPDSQEKLKRLYAPFSRNHEKTIVMDTVSAELTKYAANAMLATKISFMNEMAAIADDVGADIEQVRVGIGSDPRIGYSFIYPGAGYGGSCFPKDVRALRNTARQSGVDAEIMNAVDSVNIRQKKRLFQMLTNFFEGDLSGRKIGIWGLSFKPNTDDIREAPSLELINELLAVGATVAAHDPVAADHVRDLYSEQQLTVCEDPYEVTNDSSALVVVTEWKHYWNPDFERLKRLMRVPVIFDGRNIYDLQVLQETGLSYVSIGRPTVGASRLSQID